MPDVRPWARVVGDVNIHLRRGAWYEVVLLLPDAAVLHVSERSLTIPRSCLEIAEVRPRQWSVVSRPYDAVDLPLNWGSRYGVCPRCSQRAPLEGHAGTIPCGRCGGVFPVGRT